MVGLEYWLFCYVCNLKRVTFSSLPTLVATSALCILFGTTYSLTTWPRKSQAKALWLMLSTLTFLWLWCWLIPNQEKGNSLNPFWQCTYFKKKKCSQPLKFWVVNFLGETCVTPVFGYYSSVIIFFLNVLLHYDYFYIFNWKIIDWNCLLN